MPTEVLSRRQENARTLSITSGILWWQSYFEGEFGAILIKCSTVCNHRIQQLHSGGKYLRKLKAYIHTKTSVYLHRNAQQLYLLALTRDIQCFSAGKCINSAWSDHTMPLAGHLKGSMPCWVSGTWCWLRGAGHRSQVWSASNRCIWGVENDRSVLFRSWEVGVAKDNACGLSFQEWSIPKWYSIWQGRFSRKALALQACRPEFNPKNPSNNEGYCNMHL